MKVAWTTASELTSSVNHYEFGLGGCFNNYFGNESTGYRHHYTGIADKRSTSMEASPSNTSLDVRNPGGQKQQQQH